MWEDLEYAKKRLHGKGLTLIIVKDFRVLFESKAHGVSAFLEALDKFGDKMRGTSVADKVAGKAIALLCVYAGVGAVYASTMSVKAKQVFENHNVHLSGAGLWKKYWMLQEGMFAPLRRQSWKSTTQKRLMES